jgi:ribosomal protein L24
MTNGERSVNDAWLDDMDDMAGQYEQESAERTDREEIPDGAYQVHVDKVELVKAKKSGGNRYRQKPRKIRSHRRRDRKYKEKQSKGE